MATTTQASLRQERQIFKYHKMSYHDDEQPHGPEYGHPPLLCQELLDFVDDVPGEQQFANVTKGTGWVYLRTEQTPLSFRRQMVNKYKRQICVQRQMFVNWRQKLYNSICCVALIMVWRQILLIVRAECIMCLKCCKSTSNGLQRHMLYFDF